MIWHSASLVLENSEILVEFYTRFCGFSNSYVGEIVTRDKTKPIGNNFICNEQKSFGNGVDCETWLINKAEQEFSHLKTK